MMAYFHFIVMSAIFFIGLIIISFKFDPSIEKTILLTLCLLGGTLSTGLLFIYDKLVDIHKK